MNSKEKVDLTPEEKEISARLASGGYRSLGAAARQRYAKLAQHDLKRRKAVRKDERINVRLTGEQLGKLKERAELEGLPYQSLVASVIQRYLNGRLIDAASLASMKSLFKKAL